MKTCIALVLTLAGCASVVDEIEGEMRFYSFVHRMWAVDRHFPRLSEAEWNSISESFEKRAGSGFRFEEAVQIRSNLVRVELRRWNSSKENIITLYYEEKDGQWVESANMHVETVGGRLPPSDRSPAYH